MARTQLSATQILNRSLQEEDMDITTPGKAMITRVVAGTGITLSSTGIDPGTGVVTINSTGSTNTNNNNHDRNVDGGHPSSLYLPSQVINGGGP
jgi:hypothetical protein